MRLVVEWVNATRPRMRRFGLKLLYVIAFLIFMGAALKRQNSHTTITNETPEVLAMIGQELFILVIGQARVTSPPRNMPDLLSKLPLSKER